MTIQTRLVYNSPRDYGLPHNEWRPGQFDLLKKCQNAINNGGGFIFASAPTGTGKSGVPAALSCETNVLVLVHTLGLLDQYERVYGFDIVKGMQEYKCVHPQKVYSWRQRGVVPLASDCHLTNMRDCSSASKCPYLVAREKALSSNKAACTYRYAILSEEMQKRGGCLVMDECHSSSDEILEFSEFKITEEDIKSFGLPPFPVYGYGKDGKGDLLDNKTKNIIIAWLAGCIARVNIMDVSTILTPEGSRAKRMYKYLTSGLNLITESDGLFLFCGARVIEKNLFGKRTQNQLVIKPIDSKIIAQKLYEQKDFVLLMSATIGNVKPLADELGISNYTFYDYPHPVPKEKRPVYNLGVTPMTKINLDAIPGLYRTQAVIIAKWIESLNNDWRGIVLTTSNFKVKILRDNLRTILGDRIYNPKSPSVSQRIKDFIEDKRKGLIAVDTIQGWGTGIDLSWDLARFSVIAGVPFSNPADTYNNVRISRPGGRSYDLWSTYNTIPQACGRTSRGEYTNGEYLLNVSALADNNAISSIAMNYYPSWFKESIINE
ncbi:MAG: DEAD/DEAH box helicase family protein [Fervidobacterium sp.]|uniref:DEAD/DEAH box helicase family protein n=1 Tax=Fervidobacterium sp. TaxID=1871331 RepID=UPI0025BF52BC|nr:DEAD/DEAH box helicase family protein [Fervidobacterium sp.]NPU90217.1 DEAD/DEAH box helicase family protein [Fervidobacterium sp.]